MVRRSREEAEATRQALLDTALVLFAAQGPEAVTMKQVAAQAGVTHGAMYWHFRNKQDLLDQLQQQCDLPFEQHYLEQRQAVQQDALGALDGFVRGSLTQIARDPRARNIYRLFHYGRACSPELAHLQPLLDGQLELLQGYLHYFLKQARKQKQLRKKLDLDQISASMLISLVGVLDLWLTLPERFDLIHQVDCLLAIQLEGLRALKPSML
ncbi:TetR family transcriptional regulator [Marinobacterium sp. D7]|uniref:TetR family transcriptional regulator n=1 Tax=Marinobacterium ramblicola TaxID=2849041 RepID=UPI001C2CEBD0|nr:TetR family transcriptional regulator [Marinobacterium ramblicola]